jgi:hypothetical protein
VKYIFIWTGKSIHPPQNINAAAINENPVMSLAKVFFITIVPPYLFLLDDSSVPFSSS